MSKKMKLIPHFEYEKIIALAKAPQLVHKSASVNMLCTKQTPVSEVLGLDTISDGIKLALFNTTVKGLRENFTALTSTPLQVEISNQTTSNREINTKIDAETSPHPKYSNATLLHYLPKNL